MKNFYDNDIDINKEIKKYVDHMFKELGIVVKPIRTKKDFENAKNFNAIIYTSNNLDDK